MISMKIKNSIATSIKYRLKNLYNYFWNGFNQPIYILWVREFQQEAAQRGRVSFMFFEKRQNINSGLPRTTMKCIFRCDLTGELWLTVEGLF